MKTPSFHAVALLLAALAFAPAPVEAGRQRPADQDRRAYDERYTPPDALGAPPKDCTKFAGRYGYYGNPWCSEAEQRQWDRWEARRLGSRSKN